MEARFIVSTFIFQTFHCFKTFLRNINYKILSTVVLTTKFALKYRTMDQKNKFNPKEVEIAFAVINGNISNAINRIIMRTLKKEGIEMTTEQWVVMFCLWNGLNGEKPTQNMIAQATFKDRPSITRLLRNLERQGLIYREAKDGDKRANHVILTEKGKSIEKSVTDATKKAMESIFYGFSHEEATKAFSYLEKIFDNIK